MKSSFDYIVRVSIKNDKLTGDAETEVVTTIIKDQIVASMGDLPWVLDIDVKEAK